MPEPTLSQSTAAPKRPGKNPPGRPVFAPRPRQVVYRYTQAFRQQTEGQIFPATWGPRLLARLVELLVIGVPFNLLYDFIFTYVPPEWLDLQLPAIGRDIIFWLVFVLVTSLTAGRSGVSFGKKLLNLRLVGPYNRRLPWGRLFLREFLVIYAITGSYQTINQLFINGPERFFLDLNLLYLPGFALGVGCLPLFRNPPRTTWLDRLFKTRVVIADPQKLIG